MRWVTRAGVHIDRASSAWLIKRWIDPDAVFGFVESLDAIESDSIAFDMRGVEFGHHGDDCTFETLLRRHDLLDPALWRIAEVIHDADLEDEKYGAAEAAGLDAILRGLSMTQPDDRVLEVAVDIFDGLYVYYRRALLLHLETDGE